MSEFLFLLLALATVFIAAGGYIINDYFDVKLDHINKPKQMIIGKTLSRRFAMFWHIIISALGIFLAAYVAWAIGHPFLVLIQLSAGGLLWYYSIKFKKQVLVGNVIIALLTALVPFTAGYYELAVMFDTIGESMYDTNLKYMLFNLQYLVYWIIGYSGFAFLLSIVREIVKDMEDIEGDEAFGCRTLPIVHGIETAKRWANGISIFIALWIVVLMVVQAISKDFLSLLYFGFFLLAPLIYVISNMIKAQDKKDFFMISQTIKLIMFLGITYTAVIYYFQG